MKADEKEAIYLLSNFTHQVINPLSGVIGTIDNIIDGTVPSSNIITRLNIVRGQLGATISSIRNLAFIAKYMAEDNEEAHDEIEKICIIPKIIIDALTFYQEQAKQKRIHIELEGREIQNAVKGNPDLLKQVLMNIFDNGVKYGVEGEKIIVKDWIQTKTKDLMINVSGRSIGFDNCEDIFELGVRGKAAKLQTSSGTGIGLYVCKRIIEKSFKGHIAASHSDKLGLTIFEIRIPGGFLNEREND